MVIKVTDGKGKAVEGVTLTISKDVNVIDETYYSIKTFTGKNGETPEVNTYGTGILNIVSEHEDLEYEINQSHTCIPIVRLKLKRKTIYGIPVYSNSLLTKILKKIKRFLS